LLLVRTMRPVLVFLLLAPVADALTTSRRPLPVTCLLRSPPSTVVAKSTASTRHASSLNMLTTLRGGSTTTFRALVGLLCASPLIILAALLKPLLVFARPPNAKSSAELWNQLRENLYNAEADKMHLTKVDGAAAAHPHGAREEAARKLIMNHDSVLRDVTSPSSKTQLDLSRLPSTAEPFVDQALREVARRLIGHRPGEDGWEKLQLSSSAQIAWSETAKYLDARIQATPQEMPGRPPDMSEEAAAAMRAVLWEVGMGTSGVAASA